MKQAFAKLYDMRQFVETDFDKIYDELSKLYEESSTITGNAGGAADGFKIGWFRYIIKHYQEFLAILSGKLDFDTFYLNACTSYPVFKAQEQRCKESYTYYISRFNNDWRPKVESQWINLSKFLSPVGLKNELSQEWYNATGIYIIVHVPTRRFYIGKAYRNAFTRNKDKGFITRLYQHAKSSNVDHVDATWHELFKVTSINDYECAILKITDASASAEKDAIGTRNDFNKVLGNVFDLNMREGGYGGSVATKNTPEVINRVEDLVKNGLDGRQLGFPEIANIINNEFDFLNSKPYTHKDVSLLSKANNWRPDANKDRGGRKRDAHAIKDISCYDSAGNKIKDFDDTTEAAEWILDNGKSKAAIQTVIGSIKHAILRDLKYTKTAFGYYWKKNQEDSTE